MEIDMWTVVFVSQDKSKIDKILKLLEENKIMTMLMIFLKCVTNS